MKKENEVLQGVKGFHTDMICSPVDGQKVQYAENTVFSVSGKLELCKNGIHFCEDPLHVLGYFWPGTGSEYAAVTAVGKTISDEAKSCTSRIAIHKKLDFFGLAKLALDMIRHRTPEAVKQSSTWLDVVATKSQEPVRAVCAEDTFSVACSTQMYSISIVEKNYSCAAVTGAHSIASALGYASAAVVTHDASIAISCGSRSVSACTSPGSVASCKGVYSAAIVTMEHSGAEALSEGSLAIATCYGKVRGVKGSYLVAMYREDKISSPKFKLVKVGGEVIKENTWYTLSKDGVWVEA